MLKKWNLFLSESIQYIHFLPVAERKKGWKRVIMILMIWIAGSLILFSISHPAHADTMPMLNDLNDVMLQQYKDLSGGWSSIFMGYAKTLFMYLAAIELAWASIFWVIEKDNMTSFTSELIRKMMFICFFYAILINAGDWVPAITHSFLKAGQNASGIPLGLSPSEILSSGLALVDIILEAGQTLHLWNVHFTAQMTATCSLFIVGCFGMIAYQFLATMVEMYIIISAGVLFLGFGGSSFTKEYVMKFLNYAISIGVKLMMIYLIVGVGTKLAAGWVIALSTSMNDAFFYNLSIICAAVFIYTNLVCKIPDFVASLIGSGAGTASSNAMGGTHAYTGNNLSARGGGSLMGSAMGVSQNNVASATQMGGGQFGPMGSMMQGFQNTARTLEEAGIVKSGAGSNAYNMPAPQGGGVSEGSNMKQGSAVPFESSNEEMNTGNNISNSHAVNLAKAGTQSTSASKKNGGKK